MISNRATLPIVPFVFALSLGPLLVGGCAPGNFDAADSPLGGEVVRKGVDYAWAPRPSPTALRALGYTFASRYLSHSPTKNLSLAEANALIAAGLDVISNWETSASRALAGFNAGATDARFAHEQAVTYGMPATRPIYFSVDFDATLEQQPAVDDYMDGVASVLGRGRVGAYGSYDVIRRLFDAGKITWGWQTYAWSKGQWDARAHMRQVLNEVIIDGADCDIDHAMAEDFGQWGTAGGGGGGGGGGGTCGVLTDGKLYCTNAPDAPMYELPNASSAVVNTLRTTFSWFECWGPGELHAAGNTTWYKTIGDDSATRGWLPAASLDTTDAFDADPSAHGLARCP